MIRLVQIASKSLIVFWVLIIGMRAYKTNASVEASDSPLTNKTNASTPLVTGPEIVIVKLVSGGDIVFNEELGQLENAPHEGSSWQSNPSADFASPNPGGEILGFPDRGVVAQPPPMCKPIKIKVSYYWPNWAGPNCFEYRENYIPPWASRYPNADKSGGWCTSRTASGTDWEEVVNRGVAMPNSIQFGSKLYAFGQEWVVYDRGGAIVKKGEVYWVDFLINIPPLAYGTEIDACIVEAQ